MIDVDEVYQNPRRPPAPEKKIRTRRHRKDKDTAGVIPQGNTDTEATQNADHSKENTQSTLKVNSSIPSEPSLTEEVTQHKQAVERRRQKKGFIDLRNKLNSQSVVPLKTVDCNSLSPLQQLDGMTDQKECSERRKSSKKSLSACSTERNRHSRDQAYTLDECGNE